MTCPKAHPPSPVFGMRFFICDDRRTEEAHHTSNQMMIGVAGASVSSTVDAQSPQPTSDQLAAT
jgi:hypothetical protein